MRMMMTIPGFERWRWWWVVAVAIAIVVAPIAWTIEQVWWRLTPPWSWVAAFVMAVCVTALAGWTLGIAPWLSAGDPAPRWTTPPSWHLNTLRLAVWTPTIVLFACFAWLDLRPLFIRWNETGHVHIPWHPIMLVPIPIVLGCIAYGWIMSHRLERRLRESTWRRGACFQCGYLFSASRSTICPECGAETLDRA